MHFSAPAPEELLELVEKQDMMMDCLLQKLEMCQDQIKLLREAELKRQESEQEANKLVAVAQEKVNSALAVVEQLQAEKQKLEKELTEIHAKLEEDKPVASVIQLRNRIKELEFELLRQQRVCSSLQTDLDFQKSRTDQMREEINESNNSNKSVVASLSSKIEDTVEEMAKLRVSIDPAQESMPNDAAFQLRISI
ncbi:hypothetical protein NECAME_11310, partial [Necator americanus]